MIRNISLTLDLGTELKTCWILLENILDYLPDGKGTLINFKEGTAAYVQEDYETVKKLIQQAQESK